MVRFLTKVKNWLLLRYRFFQQDKNNIFCQVPFLHSYITISGRPHLCCDSPTTTGDKTGMTTTSNPAFWDYWDGKYMNAVRRDMLNNVPRDECRRCYAMEKAKGTSARIIFKERHGNAILKRKHDFPIDLDIRFSNLCNLKCRMCHDGLSSQIEKEITANKNLLGEYSSRLSTTTFMSRENFNEIIDNIKNINYIKVAGGEPTIMPEVEEFLQQFINNNRHIGNNAVHLLITTNCTNQNEKFKSLINQFDNVVFTVSFDGVGKVNEYIRFPSNFNAVENNLKDYLQKHLCQLNFTIQAYNLPYIQQVTQWLNNINEKHGRLDAQFSLLDQPSNLACNNLSKNFRDYYVDTYLKTINFLSPWIVNSNLKESLQILKNDSTEISNYDFAKRTKAFDIVRNQHIKDYLPEVYTDVKNTYDSIIL